MLSTDIIQQLAKEKMMFGINVDMKFTLRRQTYFVSSLKKDIERK